MYEDPEKITYFAETNSRGQQVPFGIKRRDRARHMYVIGKTGMGKSTLLENMAIQDIRNGEGMAFIDPHGSTADRLLEYVPESRIKDVVYFAPFDMDFPAAFNVMEDVGYDKRHLVVSGLLSAFRKIWVDAWSARMEYILSNTLLALLEFPGATLLDVNRMLINKVFRKKVVENVTDPIVKSFWVDEFANYGDRYTQEATPAIQNKIGQFTSNPLIRNIVGQPKSSFDIRQMMDEKKILIMNLSKGRVGEVNATLLGSMLVTKIYLAAMSRADSSAATLDSLPNFYFYVDEFQSFANETFADILSEARKYKLNLLIAHQYIEQMEEEVRNAVFGNVGTTVAFRVGPFDAEVLETIFQPQFTKEDVVNLGFAQVYLTLMIDGVGSPPFSAKTLPPFELPPQRFVADVLANSRVTYAKPRADVEKAISDWQQAEMNTPSAGKTIKSPPPETKTVPSSSNPVQKPTPPPQPTPIAVPARVVQSTLNPGAAVKHQETKQVLQTPHENEKPTPKPSVKTEQPPLGGATSLREAIEQATGEKVTKPPTGGKTPEKATPKPSGEGSKQVSTPSLKEVLAKIAPHSATPSKSLETPPHVEQRKREEKNTHSHTPRSLPEETLRKMLDVGEIDIHE